MKAVAVFPRTKEVRVIEHEVPRITEPDQVKLRILDIGICGTDKEICAFEYGTPCAGYLAYLFSNEPLVSDELHGSENERHDLQAVYDLPSSWLFQTFDDEGNSRATRANRAIVGEADDRLSKEFLTRVLRTIKEECISRSSLQTAWLCLPLMRSSGRM
jgi:hypothetical protein